MAASPFVIQAGGRAVPSLLAGLLGGAGATYGIPRLAGGDSAKDSTAQLAAALASLRGGGGVTVVTGERDSGSATKAVVFGSVAVAGAALVAMKLSGMSISSLAWVSRQQFKKSIAHVEKGMDGLAKRIGEVKMALTAKIDSLMSKQDKMASEQSGMRDDISQVQTDIKILGHGVAGIKDAMGHVVDKVEGVERSVDDMIISQNASMEMMDQANRGVKILCKIVCNSIENRETSAEDARALREFTQTAPAEIAIKAPVRNVGVASFIMSKCLPTGTIDARSWASSPTMI